MARIAVINNSSVYNYATHKMLFKFRREGHEVFFSPRADMWSQLCDKAYLSAIFTYDLPDLCQDTNLLRQNGVEVEIGGPAATAMPEYIEEHTGIKPHLGLDDRFEHVPGKYRMVFTSRGCRNKCLWCIVPRIEPELREYDNFPIPIGKNPWLGDNNILATSWEHQKLVVEKLKDVRNLDINSGFEAPLFTEDHYQLYSKLHLECFRLAFDSMKTEAEFERAVKILKKYNVDYRRIIVFVLIGFPGTTFEEAVYRLEKTRDLGCSPYPQRFMPLNALKSHYVAPGFDDVQLETLRTYWVNPWAWRTVSWGEYKRSYKPPKVLQDSLM